MSSDPNFGKPKLRKMKPGEAVSLIVAMLLLVGVVLFLGEKSDVIEVRVVSVESLEAREGPGLDKPLCGIDPLLKGDFVYVQEVKGEWIRFRPSEKDYGWSGWILRADTVREAGK